MISDTNVKVFYFTSIDALQKSEFFGITYKKGNFHTAFFSYLILIDNDDESPARKSFLRKGSGLARYGGVGGPPKRMRRSKSQLLSRDKTMEKTKFGGSCPRYNLSY